MSDRKAVVKNADMSEGKWAQVMIQICNKMP